MSENEIVTCLMYKRVEKIDKLGAGKGKDCSRFERNGFFYVVQHRASFNILQNIY